MPIKLSVGGTELPEPVLVQAAPQLLGRSMARAKIDALLERQRSAKDDVSIKEQVIELSREYRVMSPYTSLLVLETEADYARYEIDRRALSGILGVENGQVVVFDDPHLLRDAAPDKEDAPREVSETKKAAAAASGVAPGAPPAGGDLWGDEIGDAFGVGGLGLSGIGEGGGGRGEGIGVGSIGHGAGTGTSRRWTGNPRRSRPSHGVDIRWWLRITGPWR